MKVTEISQQAVLSTLKNGVCFWTLTEGLCIWTDRGAINLVDGCSRAIPLATQITMVDAEVRWTTRSLK